MDWYYASDGQQQGPVDEARFRELIARGEIQPDTLVWKTGMDDWAPLAQLQPAGDATPTATPGAAAAGGAMGGGAAAAGAGGFGMAMTQTCVECGMAYSAEEMIQFGEHSVCARCKPIFEQKLREGVPVGGELVYAGFWVRFVAKFVDNILLGIVFQVINIPLSILIEPSFEDPNVAVAAVFGYLGFLFVLNMALQCAYVTFFIGAKQATLGKMMLGLKVVLPDGGRVSYMRAFGRFWAELLSQLTLYIGYIIAAFDDEKRALHDHIAKTRVVRK